MRVIAVSVLPFILVAASEPAPVALPVPALDNPTYTTPPERWETIEEAVARVGDEEAPSPAECSDRISQARDETGQPPLLEREPASPEKPHAIYAVDRKQDGCSVMVMMGNREDIRPLPGPMEGPLQMIPAEGQR